MNPQTNIVAGMDVHKRILVVVVLDSATPDRDHATARFGTTHQARQQLVEFLRFHQVRQVAMESTAQYWRPVWMDLEGEFQLTLAQARSTHAPRGRKQDLSDARRIARRLLSGDLTASYVPGPEQREWRLLSRTRVGMLESVVRLRNQIEVLLEQAQIKLSSVVSDVLGLSGRRILRALIDGVHDPTQLAALADFRLRVSQQNLADALCGRLTPSQQLVLKLYLEQIEQIERHMVEVEKALAQAEAEHQDAIERLCEMPGVSVRSAQHVIAEIGPRAEAFASSGKLASWVGVCPGRNESAGVSTSNRSPKGNSMMRRILSQIAWATIASKGSEGQRRYRTWVGRLGPQKAAWAVAHYQLRVIWNILHRGVHFLQPDTADLDQQSLFRRAKRVLADLKRLGYTVTIAPPPDLAT
jgi:transposase